MQTELVLLAEQSIHLKNYINNISKKGEKKTHTHTQKLKKEFNTCVHTAQDGKWCCCCCCSCENKINE